MKKLIILFSILVLPFVSFAQSSNHALTFEGMGAFKLGMSKAELEKLTGTKIVLKHIGIDERYTETINVNYKGNEYELSLMRSDPAVARLEGVTSNNPIFKTAEGIGIGSDHVTIINTYEKHLLIIAPEQITYAAINDLRSSIVFTMKNNKVIKISVEPTAMFRDRE